MNDKTTSYQRNRENILNWAKEYYENNKERLRKQARNKYRELSNKEKIKTESMEEIAADRNYKKVVFKNCAPFISSISKINNAEVDNADDLDTVI